jgi:hypothetical protein
MAKEMTTIAVSVPPPAGSPGDRLGDGLYEGSWKTLDINAVGFPIGDTLLRHEKANYPPPSPDTAPGKQFVLWLQPGSYTIYATVAWTAPQAKKADTVTTPHSLLTSMTNAKAIMGDDGTPSWTDVKYTESSSVATAASLVPTEEESNFVTQSISAVFDVPDIKGSFGAVRLEAVSSTSFTVRPVPVLYALTIRTLAPFPAAPLSGPKLQLRAPLKTPGNLPPTKYSGIKKEMLAAVDLPRSMARRWQRPSRTQGCTSCSDTVTTTSTAYVLPVALFSVFIVLLIIGVALLMSVNRKSSAVGVGASPTSA